MRGKIVLLHISVNLGYGLEERGIVRRFFFICPESLKDVHIIFSSHSIIWILSDWLKWVKKQPMLDVIQKYVKTLEIKYY